MEFKIDTRPNCTVLTPVSNLLDANLTAAVRQKWTELTESGSPNIIVDLHNCTQAAESGIAGLTELHETIYGSQESLVFTQMQPEVMAAVKEQELDLIINVAPTLNEAIDIVSMEILERELFDEES